MKERDVTVVIPAYNEEKCIEKTLQSLRNQRYSSYRIVVVDGYSTDRTVEIAKKYADEVIYEKRPGAGYARYHGIDSSHSTIIASADADSIYPPDWLARVNDAMQGDIVGCFGRVSTGHKVLDLLYHYFVNLNRIIGFPQCSGNNLAFVRGYYNGYDVKCHSGEDIMLAFHLKRFGRFVYRSDITAQISDRRIKASLLKLLWENGRNYLSLLFFKKPGLEVSKVR